MTCPYCHARIDAGSKFCTECGADLRYVSQTRGEPIEKAAKGGILLGAAARKARLSAVYDPDQIIDGRIYNAIILGVLLWGLLINVLLCAYVGDVSDFIDPFWFVILYVGCSIGGIILAGRSHKPLLSFLGYNMVVVPFGLVISTLVYGYGGIESSVVAYAFGYTLLITLGMLAAVTAFPKLFERIGGALLGCLAGLVLCELVLLLLGVRQYVTDWIAAGVFSLYIGFDLYRSQQFAKTVDNAVDCALDIYLDIANLFLRLLELMAKKDD